LTKISAYRGELTSAGGTNVGREKGTKVDMNHSYVQGGPLSPKILIRVCFADLD
jgi:hypothetical protein